MSAIGYDLLAAEYYDPWHKTCRNFDATTLDALRGRSFSPEAGLVLEVGCGRGRCIEFLNIARERIVQLDASEAMLDLPNRESCLLRLHADATRIPTAAAEFSAVVGFLVDPFLGLDFLKEAFRVLKTGGRLLLTTPAAEWGLALRGNDDSRASAALFLKKDGRTQVEVPSTLLDQESLRVKLRHAGFDAIEISSHRLPRSAHPISADVDRAAKALKLDVHEVELLYLTTARRP